MLVGVIMGGVSSEKEISMLTGEQILENLDKSKYEVVPIPIKTRYELIGKIKVIDFAFIALHGKFGEDGTIQSLLETFDIPYSGSGVLSSALCMDKDMSKEFMKAKGMKTPDWIMVKSIEEIDMNKVKKLKFPLIVKPNCGGSSIGMTVVKSEDELIAAVEDALKYDDDVMLEEYIKGTEITCSMLNGEMLPILSIKPKGEFFDYQSKYFEDGAVDKAIELPDELRKRVEDISIMCWKEFKLKAYGRIDIILKDDEIYVIEINTLPGMTRKSLVPRSAEEVGVNFSQLLDKIIDYSMKE